MTVQGLLKMIQKFKKASSFDMQSGRERKRIYSTVVEEVATAVQEELSGGAKLSNAQGIAPTLDRPLARIRHWHGAYNLTKHFAFANYPYKIVHM